MRKSHRIDSRETIKATRVVMDGTLASKFFKPNFEAIVPSITTNELSLSQQYGCKTRTRPNTEPLRTVEGKINNESTTTELTWRRPTVVPAKSDSDVMFCLQSYNGLSIDRSLVY